MKAVSLHQPWASLIALGYKTCETRSWRFPMHMAQEDNLIAIHATGRVPHQFRMLMHDDPFRYPMQRHGYNHWTELPVGAILAVAVVANCRRTEEMDVSDQERAFGDWTPGRYAWILRDVRALPNPIPSTGHHKLWSMAPSVEKAIWDQVPRYVF